MGEISKQLMDHTIKISNFQDKRDYLSLSHSHLMVEEIVKYYKDGFISDNKGKLKCYKGYQMEKDLICRMTDLFISEISPGGEVVGFDGLVKGHTDFWYGNMVGECKSVLMDSWMPKHGKVPYKVFMQVQAYMLFGDSDRAIVVYESRESGMIDDFVIHADGKIQKKIYDKFKYAVELVKK